MPAASRASGGSCHMRETRSENFADTADYQAGLARAGLGAFLVCARGFKARLTWVELSDLSLLRGQEDVARVAYIKLAPRRAFVTFPTNAGSSMIWAGVRLRLGDIVFHSLGDQMYQRTIGPCHWGAMAVSPNSLSDYGRALVERNIVPPRIDRIVRPSSSAAGLLRRLHKSACRLAANNADAIAHPEVAKALDQDLIYALVTCLEGDVLADRSTHQHHIETMAAFEELLAANPAMSVPLPRLCRILGVSQRTLQLCCADFLGMGPNRYLRLRRLHAAHSALLRPDPEIRCVAEIARRYGFSELSRFATAYRALFDEKPSESLRRSIGLPGRCDPAQSA
jgi:AraC-like DNA-binding protein